MDKFWSKKAVFISDHKLTQFTPIIKAIFVFFLES